MMQATCPACVTFCDGTMSDQKLHALTNLFEAWFFNLVRDSLKEVERAQLC